MTLRKKKDGSCCTCRGTDSMSTHVEAHNISNSYSRLFDALFWLLQEIGMHLIHIHTFRSSHIHLNENKWIFFWKKKTLDNSKTSHIPGYAGLMYWSGYIIKHNLQIQWNHYQNSDVILHRTSGGKASKN